MAQLIITVNDLDATRVYDAMAASFGYNPATDGTKAQFSRAYLIKFLKRTVKNYEANRAASIAAQAAHQSADADIT